MITTCSRGRSPFTLRRWIAVNFSSSSVITNRQLKPPLHLDPSLKALLKDVDMSLLKRKNAPPHRLLEVLFEEPDIIVDSKRAVPVEEDLELGKKSPAADFGSQKIGAVVLPPQLAKSINQLIQESDKGLLHADAKRLFLNEDQTDGEHGWEAQYDVRYRSRSQSSRHAERDGTAFASVALPAHYSAIFAVLHHVKRRLGPSWTIQNIIDWGAGAGSGLWAAVHSFQGREPGQNETEVEDFHLSNSTILNYTGIEKREALTSVGKRLVDGIDCGKLHIRWRKSFQKETTSSDKRTIALSAFFLSTLSTEIARKKLVKEMWESGAEVMVLIDHKTSSGFEAIAEAREYLLKLGKKDLENLQDHNETDPVLRGSHIIAPCPHDGACPLLRDGSSRLTCGFSQRIQRPEFVRRTKHSKIGHEDIEYSYVVIRRGARPSVAAPQAGRMGEIGLKELQRTALKNMPIKELFLHDGPAEPLPVDSEDHMEYEPSMVPVMQHKDELEATLRQEAFGWPRLIFPPLKRSGHVILDGCTAEGKIMRMTIPRSQGKQPFYDARKSGWGDIFPHPPKNPAQERHLAPKSKGNPRSPTDDRTSQKGNRNVPGHDKKQHLEAVLPEAE